MQCGSVKTVFSFRDVEQVAAVQCLVYILVTGIVAEKLCFSFDSTH